MRGGGPLYARCWEKVMLDMKEEADKNQALIDLGWTDSEGKWTKSACANAKNSGEIDLELAPADALCRMCDNVKTNYGVVEMEWPPSYEIGELPISGRAEAGSAVAVPRIDDSPLPQSPVMIPREETVSDEVVQQIIRIKLDPYINLVKGMDIFTTELDELGTESMQIILETEIMSHIKRGGRGRLFTRTEDMRSGKLRIAVIQAIDIYIQRMHAKIEATKREEEEAQTARGAIASNKSETLDIYIRKLGEKKYQIVATPMEEFMGVREYPNILYGQDFSEPAPMTFLQVAEFVEESGFSRPLKLFEKYLPKFLNAISANRNAQIWLSATEMPKFFLQANNIKGSSELGKELTNVISNPELRKLCYVLDQTFDPNFQHQICNILNNALTEL